MPRSIRVVDSPEYAGIGGIRPDVEVVETAGRGPYRRSWMGRETLIFLLILGTILDIFSATVLVVPLLLPIAAQYGIDPIHLGIVFLAAMELGYLTPPVGLNLFIASHRFNKDITEIYWATQPFLLVSLLAVIIITFWPDLSLALLNR